MGCAAVGCEKLYTEQGEWHFSKLLVCKYAPISNHGIRRPYYQGMISIARLQSYSHDLQPDFLEKRMKNSLIREHERSDFLKGIFHDFSRKI